MPNARTPFLVAALLLTSVAASAATITAADAEAAAIREAKQRGFRGFVVREMELEGGAWEIEGRATGTDGVEQRLKVKVDAANGAIVRATPATASKKTVSGDDAEKSARAALEQRGYRAFELRELEHDDGVWEISGTATFPSGTAGRVKVKVDPATGDVVEVKEKAAKKVR